MKSLRLLPLLTACCVTNTLWAAEPTPAQPAEPPKQASDAALPAESAAPKSVEDSPDEADEAAAKPKTAADKRSSPQRFVPSEQVRADFDVSFPIDI